MWETTSKLVTEHVQQAPYAFIRFGWSTAGPVHAAAALVFILGQQLHLPCFASLVDHIDRVPPSMALTGSQLSQMENRTLYNTPLTDAHALIERVVDVLLPVLVSLVRLQEHAGSIAQHSNKNLQGRSPHKGGNASTRRISWSSRHPWLKLSSNRRNLRKSG